MTAHRKTTPKQLAASEPLVTRATIIAAVSAVLGALVAFGLPLDKEQQAAIMAVAAVVAPLIVAGVARGKVSPSDPPA